MQIRQFKGESMKDATEQMRRELGSDALILQSRRIEMGSSMNSHHAALYEITAAVDAVGSVHERSSEAIAPSDDHTSSHPLHAQYVNGQASAPEILPEEASFPGHMEFLPGAREELQQFRNEFEALKSTLRDVTKHIKSAKDPEVIPPLKETYDRLVHNDVEESIAREIVSAVQTAPSKRITRDRSNFDDQVRTLISGRIRTASAKRVKATGTRVIALVGPTGVGKTTTIAKLSSLEKLVHHADVALVSADTYRIGAVEQLSTFAQITDIPFEVAAKPGEMKKIVRKHTHSDVIFIDTVGRSQKMEKELEELKELLDAADPDEVHLVLSLTANRQTLLDVVRRFGSLHPNRVILSKLDEAATAGAMLSVVQKFAMPVSFITTGQTVPYDILEADAGQLASMIAGGELPRA